MATEKKAEVKKKEPKTRVKPKGAPAVLESKQQQVEPGSATIFPVVGIGASAGGLAAFEAFFSAMPVDTDPEMAFVLVQHLAPDHKSILTELVRRYTRMQVFEVVDGIKVEPNCAYIIPPGFDMAFINGTLQLLERSSPRGHRLPIDFFFRSLAQDQRERAIGIVLSGTGSDGTLGVRAIKGEGGMVMAQSPDSTEYDSMPRNAIATGMVDYVLPPAEMPAQLMTYTRHSFVKGSRPAAVTEEKAENHLKKIFILLRTQVGHDFSQYKLSTIQRRIERRMAVHQIEILADYVKYMHSNPVETEALFYDLLIGVTSFFRDPEAFRALEQNVMPKLLAGRTNSTPLRIWVPGCSTGEEAYSLAILLAEAQEKLSKSFKIVVFATDVDSRSIATARSGIYPASIAADMSTGRLNRYFTAEPDDDSYQIHKAIRDIIVFSEQDLIRDPPFSKLDLISCRNLLIYMDGTLQKKVIPLFHYALNPGGYLFLGTSEGIGEFGDLFAVLDRKQKLFRRKETLLTNQHQVHLMPPLATVTERALKNTDAGRTTPSKMPLPELMEKGLLNLLAPSAALVTGKGDILYLHGRTGLYLEPTPGEAGTQNILKMAREGLRNELAAVLNRVVKTGETMRQEGLSIKANGKWIKAVLTVTSLAPSPGSTTDTPLYLVVLQEAPHLEPEKEDSALKSSAEAADPSSAARIRELARLLQAKDEYLQTTGEELETSNEELKSSNEEMQSVNEELQSTNEELETSKEELQSTNEELATVNAELQVKVAALTRTNNDMNNLLAGTGIATIFVDHGLQILRFTPEATKIINLISGDVGRPIAHIVSNLIGADKLMPDTKAVLDTLVPKESDVQTQAGRWYRLRILPYRTMENVIEGAVLTFVDITEVKVAQEALRKKEARQRQELSGK